jgi:hypothetical protein
MLRPTLRPIPSKIHPRRRPTAYNGHSIRSGGAREGFAVGARNRRRDAESFTAVRPIEPDSLSGPSPDGAPEQIPDRAVVARVLSAAADVVFSDGVNPAFLAQWVDETCFVLAAGVHQQV